MLSQLPQPLRVPFMLSSRWPVLHYTKKYGLQFLKILDVISRCFLPALKDQGNKMQSDAVNNLQNYLNDKIYLQEPEGQYLVQQLLSKELFM